MSEKPAPPGVAPVVATVARTVVPAARSRTRMSPGCSPGTRSVVVAPPSNETTRPSALMAGWSVAPLGRAPPVLCETRVLVLAERSRSTTSDWLSTSPGKRLVAGPVT